MRFPPLTPAARQRRLVVGFGDACPLRTLALVVGDGSGQQLVLAFVVILDQQRRTVWR